MSCKDQPKRVSNFQCSETATSASWRALLALSWYASANSPYVIQGVSAAVRGRSKLLGEGEPQGEKRPAPEPSDPPIMGEDQSLRRMNAGMSLRR
jgi:hypothetical protein